MTLIALIHSRQPLRPTGASSWVKATLKAVESLIETPKIRFLCSLGCPAHELTLTALCHTGAHVEVMLHQEQAELYGKSQSKIEKYLAHQYNLPAAKLRLHVVKSGTNSADSAFQVRDLSILQKADRVYPISIRPGGFMDTNVGELLRESKKVNCEYQVPYVSTSTAIAKDYRSRTLNSDTETLLRNHYIHWTRAVNTPWPGETDAEFYRDIMNSGKNYVRSARDTLRRILSEKLIRGSTRHSPDNEIFTAFTSSGAAESVNMMRYRARYREMTCEPFGIAIPQSEADLIGARKVMYLSGDQMRKLPAGQRRFVHAEGAAGHWKSEHEWRAPGDVDLTGVESKIVVVVERESDREEFERDFGFKTLQLFSD